MLLKYQKQNLEKLQAVLTQKRHIIVVGTPKSGRKTVIKQLGNKKTVLIFISATSDQRTLYCDFLNATRSIKQFEKARKLWDPSLSGPKTGVSLQTVQRDLFPTMHEILHRIRWLSIIKHIILVVEEPNTVDNETKDILDRALEIRKTGPFHNKISRIDVCAKADQRKDNNIVYFNSLPISLDKQYMTDTLQALNLDTDIKPSDDVLEFIFKNANGNIELIAQIVQDLNKNNIDVDFRTTDTNGIIKELLCTSLQKNNYGKELKDILTILSICNRRFYDCDLSFLLMKENNIVNLYLDAAVEYKLLGLDDKYYFILFDLVKKIFSSSDEEEKRTIYNKIIKLISTFYPDQYEEKARFAKLAVDPKFSTYLLQYAMQFIRKNGDIPPKVKFDLSTDETQILKSYHKAYIYARNNKYREATHEIQNILSRDLTSPIQQEFNLLISQCLIKSIEEKDRRDAISFLSYNEDNKDIDEYLKYRLETRKIAAYIHTGQYGNAEEQCKKTTDRLKEAVKSTKSPGSEYYLNVIYRKYCNIHEYESSLPFIQKSAQFFKSKKYTTAEYIALNNQLALQLIVGHYPDANTTVQQIEKLKQDHFSIRFPREELFKNNKTLLSLVDAKLQVQDSMIYQFKLLRDKTNNADKILITSNLAIALALNGQIDQAIELLQQERTKLETQKELEGIYKYRIICNLAILQYIQDNSKKEQSKSLLQEITFCEEDPHRIERGKEYQHIIETMEQLQKCTSAESWIKAYQEKVDTPNNFYRLYELGFVFTTLFDWDDE